MTKTTSTYLALLAVLLSPLAANADIILIEAAQDFGSITNSENFDGGDFGIDPGHFFPSDLYNVTSASGFSFGYTTDVRSGFIVWSGDGAVGFDTRSLYQNGGAEAMVTISLTSGADIEQIQFDVSNGFGPADPHNVWVRSYNDGIATGFDFELSIASGGTISMSAMSGMVFDEIRIASYANSSIMQDESQFSAISIDNLFVGTRTVPEPGTLALFGIGLFGMGLSRRRKKV